MLFTLSLVLLLVLICMMEGSSSSSKRLRLESSKNLSLAGGSDDEGDPHKRKRQGVSKTCGEKGLSFIRELLLQILAQTQNKTLRSGIHNPDTRIWNRAIKEALEERFGHSLNNWRSIAHLLTVGIELTLEGEQSAFFLRVLSLVKGEN